jgi:hypothetical protein
MGWAAGVRFLARVKDLSLTHSVQTGYGAHPAFYPINTGGSFPWVKLPGIEIDHSPPSSAEVKNGRAIYPLPRLHSTVLNKAQGQKYVTCFG